MLSILNKLLLEDGDEQAHLVTLDSVGLYTRRSTRHVSVLASRVLTYASMSICRVLPQDDTLVVRSSMRFAKVLQVKWTFRCVRLDPLSVDPQAQVTLPAATEDRAPVALTEAGFLRRQLSSPLWCVVDTWLMHRFMY